MCSHQLAACIATLCLFTLPQLACAADLEPTQSDQPPRWHYLENNQLRVGLLLSSGGAVAHLSEPNGPNRLNHYDHGRLVQQSYYGEEDGSVWNKTPWRYNPVQGGGYRGEAAEVTRFEATSQTAFVETIPRHWATGEPLNECRMRQWVELQEHTLHLKFEFTYNGNLAHAPRHQETPAVFVTPQLKHLVTYDGDHPWTGGQFSRRIPGWPNESTKMTENWVAYVDEDDVGIGIYVPSASQATCYRYLGGGGSDCSYVAPIQQFALTPGLSFSYHAYLTLGEVQNMRERFRSLKRQE